MCKLWCVLALVAMYVGFAHSWDIAVSLGDELVFYNNGSKTGTERFKSQNLTALAYDEVHNMMLYVDKQIDNDAICGYNLYSKEKKCFIKRVGGYIHSIAYDPATDTLFFTDTSERSINWISLKPGSNNNVNGNLLIKMDDLTPSDIGVDSCRGYIYWSYLETGDKFMERVRFNGSDREVLITWLPIFTFAIDPQTRTMYYFDGCEDCLFEILVRGDLNGKTKRRLLTHTHLSAPKELTVSKDYIYFMNSSESYSTVWHLPKNLRRGEEPKEISKFYDKSPLGIAANYKIEDQFQGLQDCKAVWSSLGKIYERCDVSVCENYCLQGDCSINDEGLPKCRCNAGYSGKRCEVYACHGYCLNNGNCSLNETSEPVCQCKEEYVGDKCEVADCLNYCIEGECSFNEEGLPTCSCNAGYSGGRCEVYACHGYCLNMGICSLNEQDEPFCQCVDNHDGIRCETAINETFTNTPLNLVKRNLTQADFCRVGENLLKNICNCW